MQRHFGGIVRISQCRRFCLACLTLRSQVRGQILGGDSIPTLTATFSRVMRVSTGADLSFASSIDLSVMYSGCGRDHDRGRECDFRGERGLFGIGRNAPVGRLNVSNKGPRHYTYCSRNNHISEKYWMKFGQSEWAQLADSDPHARCETPQTPTTHSGSSCSFTVILSQGKYDRLCQLEFSQNGHSTTHASSSDMHVYTASHQKFWNLNSGASSHMAGNKKIMSLNMLKYPSIC